VVVANTIQRLQHHDRVSANDAHSDADFLAVGSRFGGLVEDNVQKDL
jgi:hypothetical protein